MIKAARKLSLGSIRTCLIEWFDEVDKRCESYLLTWCHKLNIKCLVDSVIQCRFLQMLVTALRLCIVAYVKGYFSVFGSLRRHRHPLKKTRKSYLMMQRVLLKCRHFT